VGSSEGVLTPRHALWPSVHLHKLILAHLLPQAFSSPPASPPSYFCPPPATLALSLSISPSRCLSLLLIISRCGEERRGVVIKEPDWSVNSAQRCMECTRPSDGPNRASYCKQHAHLDSSRPRGGAGGSHCGQVSHKERKFNTGDIVCVCVCLCVCLSVRVLKGLDTK